MVAMGAMGAIMGIIGIVSIKISINSKEIINFMAQTLTLTQITIMIITITQVI